MSGTNDCMTLCCSGVGMGVLLACALCNLALGIADIVIGAEWNHCHLNDDKANIYLIVSGSLILASVVFGSNSKRTDDNQEINTLGSIVGFAYLGVLISGMTIVWDSDRGDCDSGQYDYLYYRTVVIMFLLVACVSLSVLIFAISSVISWLDDRR